MDMGDYFIKDQKEYLALRKSLDIIFDFSNICPIRFSDRSAIQNYFIDNASCNRGYIFGIIFNLLRQQQKMKILYYQSLILIRLRDFIRNLDILIVVYCLLVSMNINIMNFWDTMIIKSLVDLTLLCGHPLL